ncbi:response regulator [Polaribacter porphyrae]|uniref:Response regulatory domain-containing protein n=1 Tax=Polaribacter porphyrae TaxID=1137780 RepID=A0A2S7WR47_9FLAO|nr:response regulator [Polaribacter porphyrae]PQJ80073.1 hypothetical protein BTO18_13210 [Polaribacter porphyrae]
MKPLSILLVDDDELQRIKFKKVCKEIKLKSIIFEADNGENALKILNSENTFDLIVSDLNMPKMNGIQFLSELKSNIKFKNIPFIIMSTSKRAKDFKQILKLGAFGFYGKPTSYKDYAKNLITVLETWRNTIVT